MTKKKSNTGSSNKTVGKTETVSRVAGNGSFKKFPIVGIGASAGGLKAFQAFFAKMPVDSQMAFVLVQHMDPARESLLPDILRRYTKMKVIQVTDGMAVKPNCVYVTPPDGTMAVLGGVLNLIKPMGIETRQHPIDFFFRSMAQDQEDSAIGIVLSGTGTDGTQGLQDIKGHGGVAMVQDLASAEYDGMPKSAIDNVLVDQILPPGEMPAHLLAYTDITAHPIKTRTGGIKDISEHLQKIFVLIRAQTGHDFSHYKESTIVRRIEKRIVGTQLVTAAHYVRYLQQNSAEVDRLFREFLIGVTSFFREPKAFLHLEKEAIPEILKDKNPSQPVRIWVPGCATGEEAYSIAMLVQEQIQARGQDTRVQVFASDIDAEAIQKARSGVYGCAIEADVTAKRLKRFFTRDGNTYVIRDEIREMMVFADQNLIKDPPFSRIDLISCRNLLIYLEADLTKHMLPLFYDSLVDGGYLFLGSAETVGEFSDIFKTVDLKSKLFKCKKSVNQPPRRRILHPVVTSGPTRLITASQEKALQKKHDPDFQSMAEQTLLRSFSAACAVIDENRDVLYIHGRTGKYLEPASGAASTNILEMAREGLRIDLTTAIHQVMTEKKEVICKALQVKSNGDMNTVDVTVIPVPLDSSQALLAVVFQEVEPPQAQLPAKATDTISEKTRQYILGLENELRDTKENLMRTIHELESANAEQKSTNEELQSSNEELQSTNEELQTAKEELQSTTEELSILNGELEIRINELGRANSDIFNLLASTEIATIFLNEELQVSNFTPAVTKLVPLTENDIGRNLSHFAINLKYDRLLEDAEAVLDTLVPVEQEVQSRNGHWYLLRVLPYRTPERVIQGVVINLLDIHPQKTAEQLAGKQRDYYETILDSIHDGVWVSDRDDVIRYVNKGMEAIAGVARQAVSGVRVLEDFSEATIKYFSAHYLKAKETLTPVYYEAVSVTTPEGRESLQSGWLIPQVRDNQYDGIICSVLDVTESKTAEDALKKSEEKWRSLTENSPDYIMLLDLDYSIQFINYTVPDLTVSEVMGKSMLEFLPEDQQSVAIDCLERVLKNGKPDRMELRYVTGDGEVQYFDTRIAPLLDKEGRVSGLINSSNNVTEHKQFQKQLLVERERYYSTLESIPAFVYLQAPDYTMRYANNTFRKLFGDVEGKLCHELIQGIDKPCDECPTFEVFENKEPQTWEWKRNENEIYLICDNYTTDSDGTPLVLEMGIDITKEKQSEHLMRESELQYRTLFETMTQGVVYQNENGEITSANPSAERILGLSLEQMQGRTSIDPRWKSTHPDGTDFHGKTHPAMIALKTGKEVYNTVMGIFHPTKDETIWIKIDAIPQFKSGSTTPYQVYTILEDITASKQADQSGEKSEGK